MDRPSVEPRTTCADWVALESVEHHRNFAPPVVQSADQLDRRRVGRVSIAQTVSRFSSAQSARAWTAGSTPPSRPDRVRAAQRASRDPARSVCSPQLCGADPPRWPTYSQDFFQRPLRYALGQCVEGAYLWKHDGRPSPVLHHHRAHLGPCSSRASVSFTYSCCDIRIVCPFRRSEINTAG